MSTIRPAALAITTIAALLLFWLRWSVLRTLGVCALLGTIAMAAGMEGL